MIQNDIDILFKEIVKQRAMLNKIRAELKSLETKIIKLEMMLEGQYYEKNSNN